MSRHDPMDGLMKDLERAENHATAQRKRADRYKAIIKAEHLEIADCDACKEEKWCRPAGCALICLGCLVKIAEDEGARRAAEEAVVIELGERHSKSLDGPSLSFVQEMAEAGPGPVFPATPEAVCRWYGTPTPCSCAVCETPKATP